MTGVQTCALPILVDAIRANIVEYTAMDEQARLEWVRNFMEAL